MRLGKQEGKDLIHDIREEIKWSMYSNYLAKGLTFCMEHAKGWLGNIQGKENRA